ncbi:MAG: hypothetical protein ACOC9J_01705 [Persicimonas sp.]
MSYKKLYAGALLVVGLMLAACESDEFADAPTARAPDRGEARSVEPSAPEQQRPSSEQNLPADHPPIDGASQRAGALPSQQQGGQQQGGQQQGGQQQGGQQAVSPEQFGKVGPLRWEAPEDWRAVKPASNMRLAEYHLPPAAEAEPATLTVFYFGKGGGGSIQDNIDRWVGQFKDQTSEPEQATRKVDGLNVHLVDAAGTFNAGSMMGGGEDQPGWRMRAAIVETPAGNFFFKLTGPEETVGSHDKGFEALVSSFEAAAPK